MKVSIAWIFDHIDADWRTIDIESLVEKFNETTAEIEHWYAVAVDAKPLHLAQVTAFGKKITLYVPELKKEIQLPSRPDLDEFAKYYRDGDEVTAAQQRPWFLVRKNGTSFAWATSIDLGGVKEMLLPAVKKEAWKKSLETADYILDIDNKSITNRPDLWGHRGFAREIAALLGLKLKPLDHFLADTKVKKFATTTKNISVSADSVSQYSLSIDDPEQCARVAGLHVALRELTPSLIWMIGRLSRIDSRAINALVDFTNYVMFDISQPMHAFEGNWAPGVQKFMVRQARDKEKLDLLDGQKIQLSCNDIVIADECGAISLAGIMGGRYSGVRPETRAIFLESSSFNAATIRKTSQRLHVRSEASARFEKSLDPMQNVTAIQRFLQLLNDAGIEHSDGSYIASVGTTFKEPTVVVSHEFIENRIGVELKTSFIKKTLEKIGFQVAQQGRGYKITVPLFRATKDIGLPEDIVEELVRFYGYRNIPFVLPYRQTIPTDTRGIRHISHIKHQLAFGLSMRELYGYSFFDESFLRTFGWEPKKTVQVVDPVSQNWYRLVTTLMPQMLKAVVDNCNNNDELRFFEFGRVWHSAQSIQEQKKVAGVFYHKRTAVNFYEIKAQLNHMFAMMQLGVQWRSAVAPYPWLSESQTAEIVHEGKVIGVAGMVNAQFFNALAEGHAFIFELDADYLESYRAPVDTFKPLPKYPSIERDVSMLVPLNLTVAKLTGIIAGASPLIVSVELVDFFSKKEWTDKKSLTFRYIMRDKESTLTGAQADAISSHVVQLMSKAGATIR